MAVPLPKEVLDSAVSPQEIAQQRFEQERRGFNQKHVQEYLRAVAASLEDAQNREAEMRIRLGKAIRRAEAAEKAARGTSTLNAGNADREVGEDVIRILETARAVGDQRIVAAEKSAEKLLAGAKAEADSVRATADAIREERTSEAEAAATEIVVEARNRAQSETADAQSEANAIRTQAVDRITQVRDECDGLIREAEEARAQILEDMERRRRETRAQVERLRVGRDRLLRSYEVVRRTLEETTVELKTGLKEAKVRGDSAARDITSKPLATRQQLEIEIADAKLIGSIKTSEPARELKPLRSKALPRPLDPPQVPNLDLRNDSAPTSQSGNSAAKKPPAKKLLKVQAPAVAPLLTPSPASDGDDADTSVDTLEDDNLDVVELADDIETVVAVPCETVDPDAGLSLFELLRIPSSPTSATSPAAQTTTAILEPALTLRDGTDTIAVWERTDDAEDIAWRETAMAMKAQRDAIVSEAARQLHDRIKQALAEEQNTVLAGLRVAKHKKVNLVDLVGDVDSHLQRYVVAIHEVAAVTYGAGADLVDGEVGIGELPAGAVEELLLEDVIEPIRTQLFELDATKVESLQDHIDPVRDLYRVHKSDHLGAGASRLAQLLCVAGVCDAIPKDAPLPWGTLAK